MLKTYKIRLYPNKIQQQIFNQHFGCCRFIYNNSLAHKIDLYKENKIKVSKFDLIKRITNLKQEEDKQWLNDVKAEVLQNVIDNIDKAYTAFFRNISKYPKFKKKSNRQSFRQNQSCRILDNTNKIVFYGHKIKFKCSKLYAQDIRSNKIKYITYVKEPSGKYYAAILCEVEKSESKLKKLNNIDKHIGIDLGLKSFLVTSDGIVIENPKFFKKSQTKLAFEQRNLSRKQKGSNNYSKQRIKVANVHNKISNQRNHFIHQIVNTLITENQSIGIEDLNVKGMVKNKYLSKSIADVSWSKFLSVLGYKSVWNDKELIRIDKFYPSSKTCSNCGWVKEDLTLGNRTFVCDNCGLTLDRDLNAAINIRNKSREESPRSNASGEQVIRHSMKEEETKVKVKVNNIVNY